MRTMVRRAWVFTWLLAVAQLPATAAYAVSPDKGRYVGGTTNDFPKGGRAGMFKHGFVYYGSPLRKIEGRFPAEGDFVFDAGKHGRLVIAYEQVTAMTFGFGPGSLPRGSILDLYWDPLEQYTDKPHYLLTVLYRDTAGQDQGVVLELGTGVIRPVLDGLTSKTGIRIAFAWFELCRVYRGTEECNGGGPADLQGLKTVYIDTGRSSENRDLITATLQKAGVGLEVITEMDDADIVLHFESMEMGSSDMIQLMYGGRGEALLKHAGGWRTTVAYAGTRRRGWGAKPATNFANAFIDAYRRGNP